MAKESYIIAGGNSVSDIDLSQLEGSDVIAINKAILDVPFAKYFITMDYSFLKKTDKISQKLNKMSCTKFFIANYVPNYIKDVKGAVVDTRWNLVYDLKLFDVILKSRKIEGFGYSWNDFRTGNNSGYCAIQLAILLGYDKINLVGFDFIAEEQTHYHGGYNESLQNFRPKLDTYYETLRDSLLDLKKEESELKIYNCSKISKLKDLLPYKTL